jgi:hypothetical protein
LVEDEEPTVRDLTDEKQGKYIGSITQNFKLQPNPNSCETTCVTNIIHELSDRFNIPPLRFSEADVNDACGYANPRGYTPWKVIPGLRKLLNPLGWTPNQDSKVSHSRMRKVIQNKECSYPIVSLSGEYMRETVDYRTGIVDDHAVVVLRSAGDWTVVYDPYPVVSPVARARLRKYGTGVVPIRTTKFIRYWSETSIVSKWTFWIMKWGKAEPLESYTEVQTALVNP